uniref:Uncharacterized protein n=1 Tax=Arundo donax TaxID=35708 RepID=A0A0A8YVR3_ARUDO
MWKVSAPNFCFPFHSSPVQFLVILEYWMQ